MEIFNGIFLLKQVPQVVLQTDASLTGWLECSSPGKINRRNMVISRMKMVFQQLELLAVNLTLQTFLKSQNFTSIDIQMDNIVDLTYLKKMGGTKNQKTATLLKEIIWEMLISKQIMIIYPAHSTKGRLGISSQSGFIGMGPWSACLSQSLPEIRNPNSRFIRLKGITPSSRICYMETRSLQHSYGPNVNSLDIRSLLRISPILSDPLCTKAKYKKTKYTQ